MTKKPKNNLEVFSMWKSYEDAYSPEEFLGEVRNFVESGLFVDFVVIAHGPKVRSMRFGSSNAKDLRLGDIIFMLQDGIQNTTDLIRSPDDGEEEIEESKNKKTGVCYRFRESTKSREARKGRSGVRSGDEAPKSREKKSEGTETPEEKEKEIK